MVGWGSPAVHTYALDADGEPTGSVQVHSVGGYGKVRCSVDAPNRRLYLGSYPDALELVDLNDAGMPSVGQGAAVDLPKRRLYFWSMRFFVASASRGLALATEAMRDAIHPSLAVDVNWNNRVGFWHRAHPNESLPNNPDSGPDAAHGYVDWLTSGRLAAHTPWSEDWFADAQAHNWSAIADGLRCCAAYHQQPFGAYVVGQSLGRHPAGASYKIFSLVGRGAKLIDLYTFGPWWLFEPVPV